MNMKFNFNYISLVGFITCIYDLQMYYKVCDLNAILQ